MRPKLQSARRGQPLTFLALIVTVWVAGRLLLWESPWPLEFAQDALLAPAVAAKSASDSVTAVPAVVRIAETPLRYPGLPARYRSRKTGSTTTDRAVEAPIRRSPIPSFTNLAPTGPAAAPYPVSVGSDIERRAAKRPELRFSRWRADAWLFFREGSNAVASATPRPSYGASQASVILSYRLAPSSRFEPDIYVRVSKALMEGGEIEAATGIKVKPIAALPLRVHAEARVTRFADQTEIRPSIYATAGIDEQDVVAGVAVRAYAQAGYVGGRFSTGFADGMAVADREIAEFDMAKVRVGAGAWAGVQKGASRVDVGPSASVAIDVAGADIRLSADYRVRVAGDAIPNDGLAITVTTGF
ncbi:hypothetical protein E3U23_02195 [Erythrobacter litoralis]|uniref:hypothetical protein n=1 Tax=Erythrobacter litoralis TaxID=39960 RepID=UPI0024348796|nr:hypothetical protein [Erythrobacter litoralis]MDG6078009.1 hypothetical protein [Erythrobacter litoralis]